MNRSTAVVLAVILICSSITAGFATPATATKTTGGPADDSTTETQFSFFPLQVETSSISEPSQTAVIAPQSDQSFVAGGIYTAFVTVNVSKVGLLEGITTADDVSSPELSVSVSTPDSNEKVKIVGISPESGYNEKNLQSYRQDVRLNSDTSFAGGTQRKVLVRFHIAPDNPPSKVTLSADPTPDADSNGDLTEVTYEVTESVNQSKAMARTADARAELSAGYLASHDALMYQEPWNDRVKRSMSDAFTVVANDAATSLVTGYADEALAGVRSLENANNLAALQDAGTAYDMSQGNYGDTTVGQIAQINQELYNDLRNRMAVDDVQRAGNVSYALTELQSLSEAEEEAWRNGNKKRLRNILYKKQLVLLGYSDKVSDRYELRFTRDFDGPLGAPSNPGLSRQAMAQKVAAEGEASKLFTYFAALEKYSNSQLDYIQDTALPLARNPAPRVSITPSRSTLRERLSTLESGESTTVTFEVTNKGGVSSTQGYLSISTPEGLNITGFTQVAGDESVSVTNYSVGDEIFYQGDDSKKPAIHNLTDIREQYDSGETNKYTITITNESASTPWLTYRTAFEPFIHDDGARNFYRYPQKNPSVGTDQQNFAAFNVSAASDGPDRPPIAQIAGSKTIVQTGTTVSFDASQSTDDRGVDAYEWRIYNASSETQLYGPEAGQQASFTFDSRGVKNVTLTVTDTNGQTDTTSQSITVTSQPDLSPSFEANRTVIEPGTLTQLRATTDADTYSWDLDDDGVYDDGSGSTTVWKPGTAGDATIGLQVTSSSGEQEATRLSYTVESAKKQLTSPTVVVDAPSTVSVNETVTFDASRSTDRAVSKDGELVAGEIDSYEWDFDSDGITDYTTASVTRSFDSAGSYKINITLTDNDGNIASAQLPFEVSKNNSDGGDDDSGNTGPVAKFDYTPTSPTTETTVTFDPKDSIDPDKKLSDYEFDFDDGTRTILFTNESTTHTFSSAGTYDVTLTVTDNNGLTNTTTQEIKVTDPSTCDPDVNTEDDLRCIEYGETKTSQIDRSDPENQNVFGFNYEPVRFYGSDGDKVTINLNSNDLDPVVNKLITPSGRIRSNPDGLANPVFGPPYSKSGTFFLSETGKFELHIGHSEQYAIGKYEISISVDKSAVGPLPGSGTANDPYLINTARELQAIENDLDAHYRLESNITAANTSNWNDGKGFDPIGEYASPFTGSLNGSGHTVSGLSINRPAELDVGLFGVTNGTAEIQHITITNADIVGSARVGILVGSARPYTTIKDVSVRGKVEGESSVGGLAGVNANLPSKGPSVIRRSTAEVAVNGTQFAAGGLVGSNSGNIRASAAAGNVNGEKNVGGLVGQNIGYIFDTYADVRVSGNEFVGGLIGSSSDRSGIPGPTTLRSYAVGPVDGEQYVGGIISFADSGSYGSLYWDTKVSGVTDSDKGTGLTTEEMTGTAAKSNMAGLAFGSVWKTQSNDYPILAWQNDGIDYNKGRDSNKDPIPAFSYQPTTPTTGTTVTFDAADSTDPDGSISSYEWNFDDGGTTNSSDESVTHTYTTTGSYQVTLTVTDDDGDSNSTTQTITVPSSGADIIVAHSGSGDYSTIQMAVDNANQGDRIKVKSGNYTEQVTIDKNITLSTSEQAQIYYNPVAFDHAIKITNSSAPTVAGFRIKTPSGPFGAGGIRTTNAADGWEVRNVTIDTGGNGLRLSAGGIVENSSISSDIAITASGTSADYTLRNTVVNDRIRAPNSDGDWRMENVTLNSSVSINAYNSDGNWSLYDVYINSSGTAIVATKSTGNWKIENISSTYASIQASNSIGRWEITNSTFESESSSDENKKDAEEEEEDDAPPAMIEAENASGKWKIYQNKFIDVPSGVNALNASTTVNATYNYWGAADGPSGDYSGSGAAAAGNILINPYYADAALTQLGTVQEDNNNTDNAPPTAKFTYQPSTPTNGTTITFNASDSTDTDGSISSYEWDINGDGDIETSKQTDTFTYDSAGEYHVKLTVTDNDGATNTTRQTITIEAADDGGYVDVDPSDLLGSGTNADPYVITNASELQALEDDLDAHYELGSDIDASVTSHWNNGHGFDPIGDESDSFTGTFNGNDYIISQLSINRPAENLVGIFGKTGGAKIKNTSVMGSNVSGFKRVGALVGYNQHTTIQDVFISGSIQGNESVGGIGYNAGRKAVVADSSANVSVNASFRMAGALVGGNDGRATIRQSFATGHVTAPYITGGLTGLNDDGSKIINTYSKAEVSGSQGAGGLVGTNIRNSSIARSYAIGSVSGPASNTGGLVGSNIRNSTTSESYWNVETTGLSTSDGSAIGLTTSQMTGQAAQTNMDGLAIGTVWETQPDSYPVLTQETGIDGGGATVPEQLKGDVTSTQYAAVLNDDDTLSASNLADAINSWSAKGQVNGVEIGAFELSELINYWANT